MSDPRLDRVMAGLPGDEDGWHTRIVLVYEDGATEERPGSLLDASELAAEHGLTLAASPDDSLLWVRLPETWDTV
ncbi:MAG TPA: hypothetical protein VMV22_08330 [Acidimicrobiales bacterium]|nr:hypothetical protein [Acidimicrobiales bacterium]